MKGTMHTRDGFTTRTNNEDVARMEGRVCGAVHLKCLRPTPDSQRLDVPTVGKLERRHDVKLRLIRRLSASAST